MRNQFVNPEYNDPVDRHLRQPLSQTDKSDESVRLLHIAVQRDVQLFDFPFVNPHVPLQSSNVKPASAPAQARPRRVLGEILRDEAGRFYEKLDGRIRPLRHVCAAPNGEIVEFPSDSVDDKPSIDQDRTRESRTSLEEPRIAAMPQLRGHTPFPRRHEETPVGVNGMGEQIRRVNNLSPISDPNHPSESGLRSRIPKKWIRPWEFRIRREEALYDMKIADASRGSLSGIIRNLLARFRNRQSLLKWKTLLSGKSYDEQLWTVSPPRDLIASRGIREWALATLERAGYDAHKMLIEWEIYWRRKNV